MIRGCREKTALYRGRRGPCGPHLPLKLCAEHGTNLAGESPATGFYRQV